MNWICLRGDSKSLTSSEFSRWKNADTKLSTFFAFRTFVILIASFCIAAAYDDDDDSRSDSFLFRSVDGDVTVSDGVRSLFGLKGFEKKLTICGGALDEDI